MFDLFSLRRFVIALTLLAASGLGGPPARADGEDQPTVHVIGIGDTNVGGDFGRKLGEDAENIITTFKDSFAKAGRSEQLKTRLVVGDDVTPKNITDVIRNT